MYIQRVQVQTCVWWFQRAFMSVKGISSHVICIHNGTTYDPVTCAGLFTYRGLDCRDTSLLCRGVFLALSPENIAEFHRHRLACCWIFALCFTMQRTHKSIHSISFHASSGSKGEQRQFVEGDISTCASLKLSPFRTKDQSILNPLELF